MAGKSWNAFAKRVLVEKNIIGIMFENLVQGGHCTHLPTPMQTALILNVG